MKHVFILGILVGAILILAGCTAGPNENVNVSDEEGKVAGFWMGLWQGIIVPVTFIISLFTDNVNFYEVHNNGNWYDFGFVLGAAIITSRTIFRRRRRKPREES